MNTKLMEQARPFFISKVRNYETQKTKTKRSPMFPKNKNKSNGRVETF